jgi:uncharacterized protein (DUF302 family)
MNCKTTLRSIRAESGLRLLVPLPKIFLAQFPGVSSEQKSRARRINLGAGIVSRKEKEIAITTFTIEHTVVASERSFEQVIQALEGQLGRTGDWETTAAQSVAAPTPISWAEMTRSVEALIGTSGFTTFSKVNHTALLSMAGKPGRAYQYAVGNPLLAVQMTSALPEVALYAPLRVVVYEDHEGRTFVAYDRFSSQLAQYQHEEIASVAQLVEQRLEALVAEAVGSERKTLG